MLVIRNRREAINEISSVSPLRRNDHLPGAIDIAPLTVFLDGSQPFVERRDSVEDSRDYYVTPHVNEAFLSAGIPDAKERFVILGCKSISFF
jgi:hypothetical protein